MTTRPVSRAILVAGAVVTGIALGVAMDVARIGGLDTWLVHRGLSPPYDGRGRTVDIDGRAVYLDCRGSGSPTVILEAGFGTGAGGWGYLLDGVAAFTRACAWDRPGLGRSEARGFHSGAQTANDLRAALRIAGESGPFVVVAHSLGGVYGRLFAAAGPTPDDAAARRDAVLAFVMIDTYEPDLGMDRDPTLDPAFVAVIRRSIDDTGAMIQGGEDLDWAATMAELEALGPALLPTHFLSVDQRLRYGDPDPARLETIVAAWHRAIAARYPNGVIEIVPDTGHLIHLERPSLVLDRVRATVLGLRQPAESALAQVGQLRAQVGLGVHQVDEMASEIRVEVVAGVRLDLLERRLE